MRFLAIHLFGAHYEMIPSVINYFGDKGDLDIVIEGAYQGWVPIFDLVKKPYKLNPPRPEVNKKVDKYYDLIIMDTEDLTSNWLFYYTYSEITKNCRILTVSHGLEVRMPPEKVDAQFSQYWVRGPNTSGIVDLVEPSYYYGVPLLSVDEKMQKVEEMREGWKALEQTRKGLQAKELLVVVLGDNVNRNPLFLQQMLHHISNWRDIKFVFVNRSYGQKFRIDLKTIGAEMDYALCENIEAVEMHALLFAADAVYSYPYPDILGTASFVMAHNTLCRLICPVKFIRGFGMNPEVGNFLNDMDSSVVVSKLTRREVEIIDADRHRMMEHTRNLLPL